LKIEGREIQTFNRYLIKLITNLNYSIMILTKTTYFVHWFGFLQISTNNEDELKTYLDKAKKLNFVNITDFVVTTNI